MVLVHSWVGSAMSTESPAQLANSPAGPPWRWRSWSIRVRLTLLFALVAVAVSLLTTVGYAWLEVRGRHVAVAAQEARQINALLGRDLVDLLLTGNPDVSANLAQQLGQIAGLHGVVLLDTAAAPVFRFGALPEGEWPALDVPRVGAAELQLRLPVVYAGLEAGQALYRMQLANPWQLFREQLLRGLPLLPVFLLLGWVLATRFARGFSRPFGQLLGAMAHPDSEQGRVALPVAEESGEVRQLFEGFNRMGERIRATREALEQELSTRAWQARHDRLTELLNRYGFEEAAEALLASPPERRHVLCYLDLDQFKLINDTVGHPAGDVYLQQLAHQLGVWVPGEATLARLGGDEFGLLLPDTDDAAAEAQAQAIIDGINAARFLWEGKPFQVGASIGLVRFCGGSSTVLQLYQAADTACYAAKAGGRNRFVWYRADDEAVRAQQSDLSALARVRRAQKQGPERFELWAQTLQSLKAQPVPELHYEVLLRLRDEAGALVPPGLFLPAAERHGEMLGIDGWVLWRFLEQTCAVPEHLERLGFADVNVSGGSLVHPDFHALVERAIQHFPFPWHKLTLEVTETSAVQNMAGAARFIERCKRHGIRFALDDFGTGMASFEYLKALPFDVVKIDGAFIKALLQDPFDAATVEFIVRLAQLRGQTTVAEFVETADLAARLAELGVDFGQGYHHGRPRPLSEWLAESSAKT